MKNNHLDARLLAAQPQPTETSAFVQRTMQSLALSRQPKARISLLGKFRRLRFALQLLLIVLAIGVSGGAVYAAVKFAPALIRIDSKMQGSRGTTEYLASNMAGCRPYSTTDTAKFEVKRAAPELSDDEVRKIIQARCELDTLTGFVTETWPTYGTHKEWRDGDLIYYARPDIMGAYVGRSDTTVILSQVAGFDDQPSYKLMKKEPLVAYSEGKRIALEDIKPGDAVFTVARVSEKYQKTPTDANPDQPISLGVIAIIKLSQPLEYYTQKQSYISDLMECAGNNSEVCGGATALVDVWPRDGGEGASNPLLNKSYDVYREVTGQITKLDPSSFTMTSRSGSTYTVEVADNGFQVFNDVYAKNYDDPAVRVVEGSYVSIRYMQPPNSNQYKIDKDQVVLVSLMLDGLSSKAEKFERY